MVFLHFSKSNSLREISNGLKSATGNLNHLGVKRAPEKSSLCYINQKRDWKLFQGYYYCLLEKFAGRLGGHQKKLRIKTKHLKIIDSTLISLCLELFDWAKYRKKKGAVKIHTVLDYDSCLPEYICITDGKVSDAVIAQKIKLSADSLIVADRAYLDSLLSKIN
jgi:hypothetical protein